ncbi:DNA adenine methylase [Mesobacillus sp. S13]|uniref:DNA adenine methylase n=1 Tax=Mesobacillus sp. S13 TaxID=2880221 RepID=UPI001CF54944|nr:DNA adenine methylase [Mesobacillus sp. S13]
MIFLPITDSPLRYPGGKTQMKKFIVDILNSLPSKESMTYVEPFAGGAGVALFLLFNNYVSKIHINDLDPSVYKFWHSVIFNTEHFIEKINNTPITIEEWHHQREIQRNQMKYTDLEIGFSTFYLNRTNVSGIINGGPIGGKQQNGKYKINCRFNKENLINKIRKIGHYQDKITISNLDASEFINKVILKMDPTSTFIFFDPPYYIQGQNLYANYYQHNDHLQISKKIKALNTFFWITTYDYSPEIEKMYQGQNKKIYSLNYSANNVRKAKEILIYSPTITLPNSLNIKFLTNSH